MPVLLLIRHATNDFVKTGRLPGQSANIHLNDEGKAQAESLGRSLKDRKLDAVYASHLERAIETAWRVAAPHGLSIVIRPDLADTNTGDLTGRSTKDLGDAPDTRDLWKVVQTRPSEACFPNGECLAEMQKRVVAALEDIAAQHPDPEPTPQTHTKQENGSGGADADPPPVVAVVMHADPIRAALAHFLGMPLDNFQRLGISPASISTVIIGADRKSGQKFVHVLNVNQVVQAA
ncbi:MAG: histidine phosphatase family protein [Candidatus Roseilinea sp.]|uniref:histidine phosphatase family protein n=1 Tax=Candidatus Roseilinea sp. TaxID=2838777 RepID=UPI00404B412A